MGSPLHYAQVFPANPACPEPPRQICCSCAFPTADSSLQSPTQLGSWQGKGGEVLCVDTYGLLVLFDSIALVGSTGYHLKTFWTMVSVPTDLERGKRYVFMQWYLSIHPQIFLCLFLLCLLSAYTAPELLPRAGCGVVYILNSLQGSWLPQKSILSVWIWAPEPAVGSGEGRGSVGRAVEKKTDLLCNADQRQSMQPFCKHPWCGMMDVAAVGYKSLILSALFPPATRYPLLDLHPDGFEFSSPCCLHLSDAQNSVLCHYEPLM